ncbi:acetyl-CoA carboxylase biotin carboxyl carrier protein subunit [Aromatoleum toluclasticum]|uniref:acetyl-CoA carboxylase biotin carboxyl carrier protein subunit n=1 Tax=Aromatoleum toluclasticum TaxID=92003 RepID=UPI001D18B079|nr:biotin/lipoyl-containing protein [Aromatoleum toluclasticum]MCC4113944.1 acetyl-CoA carboxylase biotin carboxyl carrier protein subunit [Aromatoleum toluclasticum]
MQHALILDEQRYDVALSRAADGYRLHLDGQALPCRLHREDDGSYVLTLNDHSERIYAAQRGDDLYIHLDGRSYHLRYRHPLDLLAEQQHGAAEDGLRAPMPGSLIAVRAGVGVAVTRGQTVLVIESMKMETALAAPRDGVVAEVHVDAGETFDRDALLLSLVPLEEPESTEEALS